jgi:hypothetical protein
MPTSPSGTAVPEVELGMKNEGEEGIEGGLVEQLREEGESDRQVRVDALVLLFWEA